MSCAMGLAKQAKVLSKRQIALTAALVAQTRYPTRNHAIFLLSVKAGLRAKEIAELTWDMVTDAEGHLGNALRFRPAHLHHQRRSHNLNSGWFAA